MSINQLPLPASIPTTCPAPVASPLFPALHFQYHDNVASPASQPSAVSGFPQSRKPVDELMERASSPPVVPALPIPLAAVSTPRSLTPRPAALPAPEPAASLIPMTHDPVQAANVEATSITNESLFTESSSSLPSSFYTDHNVTPPPQAASHYIQGLNKSELFEVVHPETLRAWEAAPDPKMIIFIANDTITKETHHRVTLIRKALRSIFPFANPIIGSPVPVSDFTHYRPVYPFLVHHLPEHHVRRLVMEHCWTIDDLTFFAFDFSLPPTSFVMTLTDLHLEAKVQSNVIVTELVRCWLLKTESVASFIQKHHDNLPSFMSVNEQINFAIGSVDVSHVKLGDEEDSPVVFNVYMHPPTNDATSHSAWQRELRAITYFADCGNGQATPLFHCDVCKGRDHPTTLCRFPSNTLFQACNDSDQANVGSTVHVGYREHGIHMNGINFNLFV
ncbi:hypothetical protein APHAL10511_002809 [Amanita phalloides]|nr:hypothetical protein APHAL10511_002809 [Amanita phalloides]